MKEETKSGRKGKVVTVIGEDVKARIPRVLDNIYRIEALPVSDDDSLQNDETARMYTLRTILVEGVTVVNNGTAVNVNGDFDISLEPTFDETDEKELLNKTWANKDEAIAVWETLTKQQVERAEEAQRKINHIVNTLRTSLEERQY